MEQERDTLATGDVEKTLVSPRFDEDAISHARPAVPIDEADAGTPRRLRQAANELRSSRLALILVLVSMLASGVIGALATVLYQRRAAPEPLVAAQSPSAAIPRTDNGVEESAPQGAQTAQDVARDEGLTRKPSLPIAEADKPLLDKSAGDEEETRASPQDEENQRSRLRATLDEWIATTNARDINRQKDFYMPKVSAFYRARNVSRDEVLADKARSFENADLIDVRAEGQPEITIHPNGRMATMRFRKQYAIKSGQQDRRGEVVQELRWRRTGNGWKIISERDLKVLQ